MPLVNIKILAGHSQERKDEMSRRISETPHEIAQLPKGAEVWVVWEDAAQQDWFVDGKSVKVLRSGKS